MVSVGPVCRWGNHSVEIRGLEKSSYEETKFRSLEPSERFHIPATRLKIPLLVSVLWFLGHTVAAVAFSQCLGLEIHTHDAQRGFVLRNRLWAGVSKDKFCIVTVPKLQLGTLAAPTQRRLLAAASPVSGHVLGFCVRFLEDQKPAAVISASTAPKH